MNKQPPTKVGLGMSGGIDSSVAALLLRQAGYEVIGLTMLIWDDSIPVQQTRSNACFGPGEQEDVESARRTAAKIEVPHYTIDLRKEYKKSVLNWFRNCYLSGSTPNPCAVCNPLIKFGYLVEKAWSQGIEFDYFATGHYVRKVTPKNNSGLCRLYQGIDPKKDQSYFLARLKQTQLARSLFPLGDRTKQETRRLARDLGLSELRDKNESQDFFEGDDLSVLFPSDRVKPGPIIDLEGKRIGTHRGIVHYTIGQREGLGVATGRKVYVQDIDSETNTIILAERDQVMSDSCRIADLQWISGRPPPSGRKLTVRLRYRHAGATARFIPLNNRECRVEFDQPQFAVTPGQLAAFYDGAEVLGGGWIAKQ